MEKDPVFTTIHEIPLLNAKPPEWKTGIPGSEKEIAAYFDAQFSPRFEIYREIWLKHPTGQRFRIDRILRERTGAGGLWGVELKCPGADDSFTDFSTAVAQSVDEAQSRLETDFAGQSDWFGKQFRFVFLFPCLYQIYEFETMPGAIRWHEAWAQGALKLAGKWGVGAISYSVRRGDWGFFVAGHPFYWLSEGRLTDAALKHQVASRKGSAR